MRRPTACACCHACPLWLQLKEVRLLDSNFVPGLSQLTNLVELEAQYGVYAGECGSAMHSSTCACTCACTCPQGWQPAGCQARCRCLTSTCLCADAEPPALPVLWQLSTLTALELEFRGKEHSDRVLEQVHLPLLQRLTLR